MSSPTGSTGPTGRPGRTGPTGRRPRDDRELTDVPAQAVPLEADPLDGGVRGTLRDLIPDYSGPPDPLLRVGASIRRRRSRRRALLAVGSAATAAALVAAVPVVLATGLPGPQGGGPPAANGPGPQPSGSTAAPPPPPVVHRVASGRAAGAAWRVGSTSPGGAARRCLLSEGGGFDRDTVCFDNWRRGDPLSWDRLVVEVGATPVTRVAGVAPAGAARVLVRRASGPAVPVAAVHTATDPTARFFAVVLEGEVSIRSVTALRSDGSPIGAPVTEPAAPSCQPSADNACAAPGPTG